MQTMKKVMDYETAEHFYNWLESTVHIEDQHPVEQMIHKLLRNHPDLVNTHGWSEMRRMAERMYTMEE